MENNLKYTVVHPEMGLTEDERNNLLIDCMQIMKGECPGATSRPFQYFDGAALVVRGSPSPISITITIKDQF